MQRNRFMVIVLMVFFAGVVLAKDIPTKKEKIRNAIQKGILSFYDIPFETYARLEMWDEINSIMEANNKNMNYYTFPGMYYSHPYIVNHKIWVFENAANPRKGVHIFNPDTLKLEKILKNDEFIKFEGGIREIFNNTVISGASDEDVDRAVIWNTDTNQIKTVKLEDGHYIGAIKIESDKLYIGSCGGKINVWDFDDLKFLGTCATSQDKTVDWNVFNEKECITGIQIVSGHVFGVGEKTVFIWNKKDNAFIKRYKKSISNSIVSFFKHYIIEYRDDKLIVRHLETGEVLKEIQTEKSIEDVLVTSEKLISGYSGELMLISMRHNQGMLFYDFKEFKLLRKLKINGLSLAVYQNKIFATDDKHLYQYQIINQQPQQFDIFVKGIDLNQLTITDTNYYQLLKLSLEYPNIFKIAELSDKFMTSNKLMVKHIFKYGTIEGHTAKDAKGKDELHGFKAIYDVINHSNNYYFVTLVSEWSGEYGRSDKDEQQASHRQSFFILPDGTFQDQFEVGEKEPKKMIFYPVQLKKVSKTYYEDFMIATSKENTDVSVINKYLKDELVNDWHPLLIERKNKLVSERKNQSWFYRVFTIFR